MAEYLEVLINKERDLGPIEARLQRQAEQLDQIMNQTMKRSMHGV
jgi:hypothetical protein